MRNPKRGQKGREQETVKATVVPQMGGRRNQTLAVDDNRKATATRRLLETPISHIRTTVKGLDGRTISKPWDRTGFKSFWISCLNADEHVPDTEKQWPSRELTHIKDTQVKTSEKF
jgi:hypothetical protein